MGKPAARIGDMHTCPMVTGTTPHVGGPIAPPGCPTVLIGGQPAARVGDMAICAGPPDTIASGSITVLIGGSPAARMGDSTVHGGVIVQGLPTVLIGDSGGMTLQPLVPTAEEEALETPLFDPSDFLLIGAFAAKMIVKVVGKLAAVLGRSVAAQVAKNAIGSVTAKGAARAARWSTNWQRASLDETVRKLVGPKAIASPNKSGSKLIYRSSDSTRQVVYDKGGKYFRVEDTALKGNRRYVGKDGNVLPRNSTKDTYEASTHFLNSD